MGIIEVTIYEFGVKIDIGSFKIEILPLKVIALLKGLFWLLLYGNCYEENIARYRFRFAWKKFPKNGRSVVYVNFFLDIWERAES